MGKETLDTVEKLLQDQGKAITEGLNRVGDRIDKLEAKEDRAQGGGRKLAKTFGAAAIETLEMQALLSEKVVLGRGQKYAFEVKDLDVKTIVAISGGSPVRDTPVDEQRLPGMYGHPFRPLRLLDLLPVIPASSNKVDFVQEKGFTDGAGYQEYEGDTKETADVELGIESAPIATIAHWVKCSTQVLSDAGQLQRFLERILAHAVSAKLERELLQGDGTGRHIKGFLTQAPAFTSSETAVADKISAQLSALEVADYMPSAIVMHPNLWHDLRTAKASGSGEYLSGSFSSPPRPVLWEVPVIRTRSIPESEVLAGDFQSGCALLMRQSVGVEVGRDGNDFTKNLLTLLAEVRAGLAVYDTSAFSVLSVGGSP